MLETKDSSQINTLSNSLPEDDILKKRTYAFFLDLVFISILNKTIIYTYINFLDYYLPHINPEAKRSILSEFGKIQLPIYTIVFICYFFVSYYISNGKTPAKVIFGLKIHGKDILNDNISFREASLRATCYYLATIFGLFLLAIPLFRKNRKGIPDIISNTDVYTETQLNYLKDNLKNFYQNQKKSDNEKVENQLDLFAS